MNRLNTIEGIPVLPSNTEAVSDVERGRELYAQRAWLSAYEHLSAADSRCSLGVDDIERLAWSAALVGRDEALLKAQERLYHIHVQSGDCAKAARTAFWLGYRLLFLGERGRATGWLGLAQELIDRRGCDCVERGYLLLPLAHRHLATGDFDAAIEVARCASEYGNRYGDADLNALGLNLQSRALIPQGHMERGLALLDQAMVAATSLQLSPIVTGLIYCGMISSCHKVYALARAREWTDALGEWCNSQPELVTFAGNCSIYRAEIMQLSGDWNEAIAEARHVSDRFSNGRDPDAVTADAFYQQAEIHRLRGEFDAAEAAYGDASQYGREPQPGLALLRLAQGCGKVAESAMQRVMAGTTDSLQKARFLPAFIEILLAVGNLDAARSASCELDAIAAKYNTDVIHAMAAHARGAICLTSDNAQAAIEPLQSAFKVWRGINAPYLAARLRVLLAHAYRALGDEEGGLLELQSARKVFETLGAKTDLANMEHPEQRVSAGLEHGLTPRELEVLRWVAAGKTNRAIAAELCLSEKTVDRHLSNIFNKLDVPTRAAATAYAYEHGLK